MNPSTPGSTAELEKYSLGCGDRFGRQGEAQLQAFAEARRQAIRVAPVWNKSHREHATVGTGYDSVRNEADAAAAALGWTQPYHVDADHIRLDTVDGYIPYSDFFTLDVADKIGAPVEAEVEEAFVADLRRYCGTLAIPGVSEPIPVTKDTLRTVGRRYLAAISEAGRIYRRILEKKVDERFITEVSIDETELPQTPEELFFILAAIARERIPVQTIAPKFFGRFNKGVDYVGDLERFSREFYDDLHVIRFAIQEFDLPEDLKISVHSGSDKFSIFPVIRKAVREHGCGLHLKTAGTTWLEEIIGLAEAGGEGLAIAQAVYRTSLTRFDELCAPYSAVIDIRRETLPLPDEVDTWSGTLFAETLRHNQNEPRYNREFRQLLHVGYKVAAEMGSRYTDALQYYREIVARQVHENLLERHLKPIFG
ncbi:MAG: hypothetical protein EA384_10010 [Spirochaetaceae bacterium]|nr:MAG: hypothetical protein EA384_10010 [Spirochaetaceae bacterium]